MQILCFNITPPLFTIPSTPVRSEYFPGVPDGQWRRSNYTFMNPKWKQTSMRCLALGDQNHTFPLLCNGQELRIHQNLKNALPYLAQRQSTLPIWIDAVCINQSDSEEKFTQIRMMHRIYGQATQVWVWLGRRLEHSADAIALLPKIATAAGNYRKFLTSTNYRSSPLNHGVFQRIFTNLADHRWHYQ